MKKLFVISVSTLLLFSCNNSSKPTCTNKKLFGFAQSGMQAKINACYANGVNILISNEEGKSIYSFAKDKNRLELMSLLREIQIMEWKKNGEKMTPENLFDAVEYDNTTLVSYYLKANYDPNPKRLNGLSPIVFAVFNDSNNVIEQLLNAGVDVNYQFDFRPLITIATMFNQKKTVEILLENGANVNDIDGSGVTPLMFAVESELVDMAKFLLANGADKSVMDVVEKVALDRAIILNNDELFNLLSE